MTSIAAHKPMPAPCSATLYHIKTAIHVQVFSHQTSKQTSDSEFTMYRISMKHNAGEHVKQSVCSPKSIATNFNDNT
jgi:hypothetical protein